MFVKKHRIPPVNTLFLFADQLLQGPHQGDSLPPDGSGDLHRREAKESDVPVRLDQGARLLGRDQHPAPIRLGESGDDAQFAQPQNGRGGWGRVGGHLRRAETVPRPHGNQQVLIQSRLCIPTFTQHTHTQRQG